MLVYEFQLRVVSELMHQRSLGTLVPKPLRASLIFAVTTASPVLCGMGEGVQETAETEGGVVSTHRLKTDSGLQFPSES